MTSTLAAKLRIGLTGVEIQDMAEIATEEFWVKRCITTNVEKFVTLLDLLKKMLI